MKCPKCGYLGFESLDRCRNCGYDFSLSPPEAEPLDLVLDREIEHPIAALDLDRIIGTPDGTSTPSDLPLFAPSRDELEQRPPSTVRPGTLGRGRGVVSDDAPLITLPARPRTPLGVRRATPEVPRARPRAARPAAGDMLFEPPPSEIEGRPSETRVEHPSKRAEHPSGEPLATPPRRIVAALVDASLLCALDALVLSFTLRICGLAPSEISKLPILPLTAFFLLLNGGYFIAFTTVGGQSIGKMAMGIKVIAEEDGAVPVGRATVRALGYLVSALPFGAGFLPGVMSADRLALHDRLAHTRVVRPTTI